MTRLPRVLGRRNRRRFRSRKLTASTQFKLLGPEGTTVQYITAWDYKCYKEAKTAEKDWQWGQAYQLNPKSPPAVLLREGSRYCFRVRTGDKELPPFLKSIDMGMKDFEVPLR